ncbi:MAG: hypothetical protein V4484_03125 [Pseudomonadota bacterium]
MKRLLTAAILAACFIAPSAFADTTFKWSAIASDKETKAPIEGVLFTFKLVDKSNGKESVQTCMSDAKGYCGITAVASGGFFSGANMNVVVTHHKDGYLDIAYTGWSDANGGRQAAFWLTTTADDDKQKQAAANIAREAADKSEQAAKVHADFLAKLADAEANARLTCATKSICDKMFALTEIYVSQTATMKIQSVTATRIETHNPIDSFALGMNAYRVPGKGDSSSIMLKSSCKDFDTPTAANICLKKQIAAMEGFAPFMKSMLQ